MSRFKKMKYTYKHRREFIKLERQLLGYNTIRGLLHDVNKYILILIFGNKASKLHRKFSRHHDRASTQVDYLQMVIDWECARFSKPDKPLNAEQTLKAYYPELTYRVMPIIKYLGL